jgi:hypothetical protein
MMGIIGGIRCVAFYHGLIFAGADLGILHVLNGE